jgi:hypothetical protein
MNDTSEHMRKKQAEIMLAMTPYERFMQGIEMIEYVRTIAENSIRRQNPGISPLDLKIEMFRKYYKTDFPADQIKEIENWMRKKEEQQHAQISSQSITHG